MANRLGKRKRSARRKELARAARTSARVMASLTLFRGTLSTPRAVRHRRGRRVALDGMAQRREPGEKHAGTEARAGCEAPGNEGASRLRSTRGGRRELARALLNVNRARGHRE